MSLTLDVTPEIERALEMKARRRGVNVTAYAAAVLEREAVAEEAPDIAARLAALDEFEARAREYSGGAPPLSDYAASRASVYEGRGL